MTNKNTVIIDGQEYDAVTGLPVSSRPEPAVHRSEPSVQTVHKPASILHSKPQRSITLHRKSTKRPIPQKTTIQQRRQPVHMDSVKTHTDVRRFTPQQVIKAPQKVMDFGPVTHPHVAKAHAASAAKAQTLTQHVATAQEIKTEAVKKAVDATQKKQPLKQRLQPRQRTVAVLSAVFALVLLGGYFTYLNMPSLSVRVAAAQAGIDADYPDYRPDGYALSGPVTYSEGKVSMNFKANGGDQNFVISQSKSGWNSEAVLDNYVAPKAGSSYIPYTERGLTIYTYDDNAAWVNGGILYTLEGDAPLSSEQIRRIATSLL